MEFLAKNPTFPLILISALVAWLAYQSNRHLARAKNTIDFESSYHDSDSIKTSTEVVRDIVKNWTIAEVSNVALNSQQSSDAAKHIRDVLNVWERASIAVQRKVYDESMLYDAYGTMVIMMWTNLQPYISSRQAQNHRIYKNVEWLAIRWKTKRDNETASAQR